MNWKEAIAQRAELTPELTNEIAKHTPKVVASFSGKVIGIGNEFTNSRGNLQRAVVIEVSSDEIARQFEKYAPVTSVNGKQITIFVHPTIANKASIDGKCTVSIDQRIENETVYRKDGKYEFHTQNGYGISGAPQFEASDAEKVIDVNKKKVQAYSDEETLKQLKDLASAGVNVALNL